MRLEDLEADFSRILVREVKLGPEFTDLGLQLVGESAEKPRLGQVVSVGSGRLMRQSDGTYSTVPLKTKVGEYIIFGRYAGQKIRLLNQDLLVMEEQEKLLLVHNFEEPSSKGCAHGVVPAEACLDCGDPERP